MTVVPAKDTSLREEISSSILSGVEHMAESGDLVSRKNLLNWFGLDYWLRWGWDWRSGQERWRSVREELD